MITLHSVTKLLKIVSKRAHRSFDRLEMLHSHAFAGYNHMYAVNHILAGYHHMHAVSHILAGCNHMHAVSHILAGYNHMHAVSHILAGYNHMHAVSHILAECSLFLCKCRKLNETSMRSKFFFSFAQNF